ncbi:hypothetical protein DOTSEDRAFT_134412 [Dothistroma septosporum NZE10]|uniref:Uncharacterized protein n=1 Tax=Dothistroma septosporum (strain NZE10 / CBS 128990) TaxID=675120 RepID=N1PKB2_DOTSN|nr:hypothetical protein DOTSEDRAFT_134412 [Dothistroma septosporum NZE10]
MLHNVPVNEKAQGYTHEARKLLPKDDVEHNPNRALSQGDKTHSRFFYISFALLNICIGLSIGYLCVRYSTFSVTSWGINPTSPIPKDVFTARQNVAFSPDKRYMGPGHEVNVNWEVLTDADSIYLPDPERYGMHDVGIKAPMFLFDPTPAAAAALPNLNNFYVLNTLHQLHCTNVIRRRYNKLVYDPSATPLAKNPTDEGWIEHVEHCIEYLRLSITCADYMTFESDSPPGSPPEFYEGGLAWGVVHSCVNWDRLMEFQRDQLQLYNSTWNPTGEAH